ncbi:MAG: carboxypeptidase regulatory-like domain-containing protein [Treponema sp.]|nr:carboxypeptidase regulatory-like domain-containing protein [Treponema sp.]
MKSSLEMGLRGLFGLLNKIVFIIFLVNATAVFAQQLASITGRYTDSDGSNMRMAMVAIYDSNRRMVTSTMTGTDGRFTFSGLQAGNYFLQFSKSGAPDVWHGGGNGQAVTVGNANVTVNFQYPQGLNITGIYTDTNGSAMRMAMVALYDSNRRMVTSTMTGTDGRFTFSGLQAGNYFLQFSKSGAPDVWHGGGNGQAVTIGSANVTVNFQYPR